MMARSPFTRSAGARCATLLAASSLLLSATAAGAQTAPQARTVPACDVAFDFDRAAAPVTRPGVPEGRLHTACRTCSMRYSLKVNITNGVGSLSPPAFA
jgi:hypothetical protein